MNTTGKLYFSFRFLFSNRKKDESTRELKQRELQEMKLKNELDKIAAQRNVIEKRRKKTELR